MPAVADSLLLKFRAKDTRFGVTRATVKAQTTAAQAQLDSIYIWYAL